MQLNAFIERGEDPRVALRPPETPEVLTVAKAHAIYMDVIKRGERKTLKPRTISDKEYIYEKDIGPRLGRFGLFSLTEDDCWDAVYDRAKGSKVRANKMAGELSCFLKWCSGREGRMAGLGVFSHPALTLNSNWFKTGMQANERFLDKDDLGWFLLAVAEEFDPYRRGLFLLLLSAARRNELFGGRSAEIVDGLWTLPSARSKTALKTMSPLGLGGGGLSKPIMNGFFHRRELMGRNCGDGSRCGTGFIVEWKS